MLHSIICVKTHFKMPYNQFDNIPPCTLQEVNESPETLRYIWYPGAVYLVSGISVISGIQNSRSTGSRHSDDKVFWKRCPASGSWRTRRSTMSLGEEDSTTWASKTLQKNCFSGCESRSLVGWTSTTTRWTLTPVSSKLAAVSLWRKKGQHAKLFSLQITTQKTWWLARPSSSTTWSGSAVYSISSQSKTCRSSFTQSSFPQVIHVTTMAKCISIKNTAPELCILISASWDIYSLSKKIYRRSQMVTAAQKSTFS